MRRFYSHWLCATLLLASAPGADSLDAVLERMDRDAVSFRDLTARVRKDAFTAVLNETNHEIGTLSMKRAGGRILLKAEFTEPDARSVALEGTIAQIYYPKIQTVQIYDLGKNRALIDQFSSLGFATTRRDMERNYTIRLGGREALDGRPTVRIELIPKSPKALEQVRKIELWIPLDAGYPVQQRFLQPGGDYHLIRYADIRRNTGLTDAACRLDLPWNTRREYPQK